MPTSFVALSLLLEAFLAAAVALAATWAIRERRRWRRTATALWHAEQTLRAYQAMWTPAELAAADDHPEQDQ